MLTHMQAVLAHNLMDVPDTGPTVAWSVVNFLADGHNRQLMERLAAAGLTMERQVVADPENLPLSGKRFVFTGSLSAPRPEFEKRVADLGGVASSSVSKNTDYLVAGDKAGSKLAKAQQLGVTVLDEAGFEALLSNLNGE
jgi:DNA ligase (NAD+)